MHRIFLLSPASARGKRARAALRESADFPLARALRAAPGAELGDVFASLSGLYFRGKLRYARAFGRAPDDVGAVQIITSTRGLLPPETHITARDLREFADGDIRADEPGFVQPLEAAAQGMRHRLAEDTEVVLLGSIATNKYLDVLLRVFDVRLRFPEAFIGRGDMSRGGLLLRAVDAGEELTYLTARDAPRRGPRPPTLAPLRCSAT